MKQDPAETLREIARELEGDLESVRGRISQIAGRMTETEAQAMAAIKNYDDRSARAALLAQQTLATEMAELDADAKVLRALLAEIQEFLDEHTNQKTPPSDSLPVSGAHWAHRPTPEERAAELERDERETRRDIRRAFAAVIAACFFWLGAGLTFMGWGFHTMDRDLGETLLLSGLLVGYTGIAVTLGRYYLRGEREGWW